MNRRQKLCRRRRRRVKKFLRYCLAFYVLLGLTVITLSSLHLIQIPLATLFIFVPLLFCLISVALMFGVVSIGFLVMGIGNLAGWLFSNDT